MDIRLPVDSLAVESGVPSVEARRALTTFIGFSSRAGTYLADMLLGNALHFGLMLIMTAFAALVAALLGYEIKSGPIDAASDLEFSGLGFLATVLYFVVFEWIFGATPVKAGSRMRVVMEDGRPLTFKAALLRALARIVPDGPLLLTIPAWLSMRKSPQQQRLGDRWARTVVVDSHDPGIAVRRGFGRFALACFVALVISTPLAWLMLDLEFQPVWPVHAAADINLTQADVTRIAGPGLTLTYDEGNDTLNFPDVSSASNRVFEGEQAAVVTLVSVYRMTLVDTEDDLRAGLSEYIDAEAGGEAVTRQEAQVAPLGDLCMLQKFAFTDYTTSGAAVMCRWQNRFARVLVYDYDGGDAAPKALMAARLLAERAAGGTAVGRERDGAAAVVPRGSRHAEGAPCSLA